MKYIIHLQSFVVDAEDEAQARRKARYVILNPVPSAIKIFIEDIEQAEDLVQS